MMTDKEFLDSVNAVRRASGGMPLTLEEAVRMRDAMPGRQKKPYDPPTVRDATPEEAARIKP